MLLVDADAIVGNDLTAGIQGHVGRDAALFLRLKHKHIRRRVLAAAAMVFPTESGLNFLRDCAASMIPYVQKPVKEPIDQMLLYFAWHAQGSRKKNPMSLEKVFGPWRKATGNGFPGAQ